MTKISNPQYIDALKPIKIRSIPFFCIFGMMNKLIEPNTKELREVCIKNAVKELYIFGSALTDEFSENSDVDIAFVLQDGLSPIEYGDAFFGLVEDLEDLFDRKIDLVSYRNIKNPIFKAELDRTKRILYATA